MRTITLGRCAVAIAAITALTAACTSPAVDEPSDETPPAQEEPDAEPPPVGEPDPEPDPPDDATGPEITTVVYAARSGSDRVWVEPVVVDIPTPTGDAAYDAMRALFAHSPADPELFTAVPVGVDVIDVEAQASTLVVDLASAIADSSASSTQELAFAEQLAHTAAAIDGIDTVRVLIDGEAIDDLWGHLDWSVPIEPDPFALTPITIASPTHDEVVAAGEVTIEGEATVFEATFTIRLLDGDATLLEETYVMATMGAPERGNWHHTFHIVDAGVYRVEVEEYDASDGEGREPLVAGRTFTVD